MPVLTYATRRSPLALAQSRAFAQQLCAAIGTKPDVKAWTLLTIALGQVGIKMTALAATMDAHNVEVISGAREQITPFMLLQNWAQLIMEGVDPPE